MPYLLRVARGHARLFGAALFGVLAVMLMPDSWRLTTRLCLAWDAGAALYLCLVGFLMFHSDTGRIRRRALREDEGRVGILLLTVAAALASLGAIVGELGGPTRPGAGEIAMLIGTILLSWALTHTVFAVHYAHRYYEQDGGSGLAFPGNEEPDYWDFVYFSFVIGMTSQVSDVAVTSRALRRTVLVHGIFSFAFNTALVALAVNIAASAVLASGS